MLTPFKITLLLHRFIKKFLKIFQAHGNSPPPPPSPLEVSSKWTSKRIVPKRRLVAIQRKVRDNRHDLCSGQQVLLKLRCLLLCFPETRRFSVRNRAQVCLKLYHSKLVNDVTRKKSYRTVAKLTRNNTHGQES